MADLESLDAFFGKYVSITEPDGEGIAGYIEQMADISFHKGQFGRQIVVDYGMEWFVTQSTKVEVVDPPRLVGEASVDGDRGFLLYGGKPIETDYGHTIRVKESSAADGPHVWLFIDCSDARTTGIDPHLSLAQAIALRSALDQFIESVPERWSHGDERMSAAREIALGRREDGVHDAR